MNLLLEWGALDIEAVPDGLMALLPDSVSSDSVAAAFRGTRFTISPAIARDDGSVWLLSPRAVRIGSVLIVPSKASAPPQALQLMDAAAFGTGHHPTTALCIEALEEIITGERIESVLDVGTGSGILALVALRLGIPRAVGLDIDSEALKTAAQNASLNHFADRLQLVSGNLEAIKGRWPLVVANVLAAPLMDMAPALVQRIGSHGYLLLSGIPWSLAAEVQQTYEHFGIRLIGSKTRAGWTALIARTSW